LNTIMPIAANIYYHAYEQGDGGNRTAVVLIHGAGGTHLHWPSEIRRLPGYRIYAPDLPGHGKSEGRGEQSIGAYARAMINWLDALQVHQAICVGHSMGGAIALTLGLENPDRIAGLGLISTGARLPVAPQLLESTSQPTTFYSALELIRQRAYSPDAPEKLVELATRQMALIRPSVLHGDFLACNSFDLTDHLSEIHQPSLVLCGGQDRMTPLRMSQVLANCLPIARLETLPQAGHMIIIEQPPQTAAILENFLNSLR
jgi:pimeloyl-ACP methyl ester carboxylesterase